MKPPLQSEQNSQGIGSEPDPRASRNPAALQSDAMSAPVAVPELRTRAGQLCVAPAVADAVTGLALIVLPLLGLVAYLGGTGSVSELKYLAPLLVVLYVATCVIAVHGFLSDATPWRASHRHIPLRALGAALVYSFVLAWGASFVALPDAPAARAAVEERIAEFESRTSSAASSAAEAGESAPAITAPPNASTWDDFLATGAQHLLGMILLGVAIGAFGYLVFLFASARSEQLRRFPKPRPFDIPDHDIA